MKSWHLALVCSLLTIVALGVFAYKVRVLALPLTPNEVTTIWTLEVGIKFDGKQKNTKLSLHLPVSGQGIAILDESFISQGFGLQTTKKDGNRSAHWSLHSAPGRQQLFYRAVMRFIPEAQKDKLGELRPDISPAATLPALAIPLLEGSVLTAAQSLAAEVRAHPEFPSLKDDLDSIVLLAVRVLNEKISGRAGIRNSTDDRIQLLLNSVSAARKSVSSAQRAQVASMLLGALEIPNRVVHGVALEPRVSKAELRDWLEIYRDGAWFAYQISPATRGIPPNWLSWWRGTDPLLSLAGAEKHVAWISIDSKDEVGFASSTSNSALIAYSLFSLPLHSQLVYRILLLVPLGALVIVLLRNLIGVQSFGTFMPVLVALAFRETQLIAGIALFVLIVGLGLLVRLYLEHLKLLLVPRLACIVTIVVLLMAATSVLTHSWGVERGLSVALFPMVIMAMTIERISVVWEELGWQVALRQGFGTLLVAVLAYFVMSWRLLEHLVFVFPELLLLVLALMMLLGRYTGYRLLELKRFRELASVSE